jgi:hypothetical protein
MNGSAWLVPLEKNDLALGVGRGPLGWIFTTS